MASRPVVHAIYVALMFAPAALWSTESARAQLDPNLTSLMQKLDDATRHFSEARGKAKAAASANFDKLIAQVKSGKMPATVKADKLTEVIKAKKQFQDDGTFLPESEYAQLQLKYYLEINKSYRALSKLHYQLMDAALKSKDEPLRMSLQERRRTLDAQLPGAGAFVAGSQWFGTLSLTTGTNLKFNLHVDKLTGSVFHASVGNTTTVATHPKYLVEGVLDGVAVKFNATKIMQGDTTSAVFNGILAGNRMIGTLDQVTARGKHTSGIVNLSLK